MPCFKFQWVSCRPIMNGVYHLVIVDNFIKMTCKCTAIHLRDATTWTIDAVFAASSNANLLVTGWCFWDLFLVCPHWQTCLWWSYHSYFLFALPYSPYYQCINFLFHGVCLPWMAYAFAIVFYYFYLNVFGLRLNEDGDSVTLIGNWFGYFNYYHSLYHYLCCSH